MVNPGLDKDLAQEALDAYYENGEVKAYAAKALGLQVGTYVNRLNAAHRLGLTPVENVLAADDKQVLEKIELENKVRSLSASLRELQREEITRQSIRKHLFELRDYDPSPPKWMLTPQEKGHGVTGVPCLFASDWQWGEVVQPSEINDFNAFNIKIANDRVKTLIEKTVKLLYGEFKNPSYPGIVFALGGDMVSGDSLHEDLTRTNEERVMPVVLELVDVLVWCVDTLLEHFPRIHIPCVPGNHGRTSRKPPSKELSVTNWDWLIGQLIERHYRDDTRVTLQVENSPDCFFNILGRRYCMTHGDQFRGGDGIIGPLGPITRGRMKKASRDTIMRQPWDTMICGHHHWLIQMDHLIVNGSLPGYSEYAYLNNMTPTRPAQALWITHEEGITHQLPIYLDRPPPAGEKAWVSIPA